MKLKRFLQKKALNTMFLVTMTMYIYFHRLSIPRLIHSREFRQSPQTRKYELECFGKFCNETVPPLSMNSTFMLNLIERQDIQKKPLCPEIPPGLVGGINFQVDDVVHPPEWKTIAASNPYVKKGGRFTPHDCAARHRVAIIFPLRGEERVKQFRVLLNYMLPIWQRQQIEFTVYTVSPVGFFTFNKAKLMNAGFIEASKDGQYDCFVFHDVDLLVNTDHCLYWCSKENPRHLAQFVDKFGYYELLYRLECAPSTYDASPFRNNTIKYFGGVTMFTKEQLIKVNGFSNLYWGWGGEDDDMFFRMWSKKYKISHSFKDKCFYHMMKHEHEGLNAAGNGRNILLSYSIARQDEEGLNTLRYKFVLKRRMSMYTNITVDTGYPNKIMTVFHEMGDSICERPGPWMWKDYLKKMK